MKFKMFFSVCMIITINFIFNQKFVCVYADTNTNDLQSIIILNEDTNYQKNEINYLYNRVVTNSGDIVTIGSWPVNGHTNISSQFGNRIHPITREFKHHKGIDIPANYNTDITSIDDGEVVFSGVQNGYGNVVIIKHNDSKVSLYAHNNTNIVKYGQTVKRGQLVAKVGSTGMSTGPHLHFEIKINGENVDPTTYIDINENNKLANNI